jgi:hypothetical protein
MSMLVVAVVATLEISAVVARRRLLGRSRCRRNAISAADDLFAMGSRQQQQLHLYLLPTSNSRRFGSVHVHDYLNNSAQYTSPTPHDQKANHG